ncbi:MAG: hypothetical protein R3F19_25565 [Verrucomicrobiales bacterium]
MKSLSKKLDGASELVQWADHCLLDWEEGADKVVRHMKKHPVPYTVAGVGLGWILFRAFTDSKAEQAPVKERLGHAASDAGERISHAAQVIADEARETAGAVRDIIGEAASDVAKRARKTADHVADSAKEVRDRIQSDVKQGARELSKSVDEKQLAIGAGLLAAGVIAGLLLPRTRKEDQLLGPARDHLKENLAEAGRDALERGREFVHDSMEAARSRAPGENGGSSTV